MSFGTVFFRRVRKADCSHDAEICAMYRAGAGMQEIVNRLGLEFTAGYVLGRLQANSVRLRSQSEAQALRYKRAARRSLIADAARKVFGERYAPPRESRPKPERVPDAPTFSDFEDWGEL